MRQYLGAQPLDFSLAPELAARLDAGTLELRVRDSGTGLKPGDEKKVFEKFYRGTDSKTGGTGLGLSIVAGITRAHGGEISAANNPTGGATFSIRSGMIILPLLTAPLVLPFSPRVLCRDCEPRLAESIPDGKSRPRPAVPG